MNEERASAEEAEAGPGEGARPAGEGAPTLERIDGKVPAATSARGRYVRFFAGAVVILFAVALAWGAVMLVSSIHHG